MDAKFDDYSGLYATGGFRHLKRSSVQCQQTVDTLVAHGADLLAQDYQVGHAAGKESHKKLLSMSLILPIHMQTWCQCVYFSVSKAAADTIDVLQCLDIGLKQDLICRA